MNRMQLLTNNVSEVVGEYLNGMMDCPDDYPPMAVWECIEYVRPQLFDIYSWGNGRTDYAPGIACELNFLGSRAIEEEIYRNSKEEGILKDLSEYTLEELRGSFKMLSRFDTDEQHALWSDSVGRWKEYQLTDSRDQFCTLLNILHARGEFDSLSRLCREDAQVLLERYQFYGTVDAFERACKRWKDNLQEGENFEDYLKNHLFMTPIGLVEKL